MISGTGVGFRSILADRIVLFPGARRPAVTAPRDLPTNALTFLSLYSCNRRSFASSVSCSSNPSFTSSSPLISARPSSDAFAGDPDACPNAFLVVRRVGRDLCDACLVIRHNAKYPSKLPFSFSSATPFPSPTTTSPTVIPAFGTETSANGLLPKPSRSKTLPAAGEGVHKSMIAARFVGVID